MTLNGVNIPDEELALFCRQHSARSLAFFGSILREDFSAQSDIDILVDFEPGKGPSLLGFAGMQLELERLLRRAVHLHTPAMLPPRVRGQIQREARLQYAA